MQGKPVKAGPQQDDSSCFPETQDPQAPADRIGPGGILQQQSQVVVRPDCIGPDGDAGTLLVGQLQGSSRRHQEPHWKSDQYRPGYVPRLPPDGEDPQVMNHGRPRRDSDIAEECLAGENLEPHHTLVGQIAGAHKVGHESSAAQKSPVRKQVGKPRCRNKLSGYQQYHRHGKKAEYRQEGIHPQADHPDNYIQGGKHHPNQGPSVNHHSPPFSSTVARLAPHLPEVAAPQPDGPCGDEDEGPVALEVQDVPYPVNHVSRRSRGTQRVSQAAQRPFLGNGEPVEHHQASQNVQRTKVDHGQNQRHDPEPESAPVIGAELQVVVLPVESETGKPWRKVGSDVVEYRQKDGQKTYPEQTPPE